MSRLYTYRRPVDFRARNVPVPYDSLIVSEDFTTDPRPPWVDFGVATVTVSGGIIQTAIVAQAGANGASLVIGPQREVWWQQDYLIVSGHSGFDAGEGHDGVGITEAAEADGVSLMGVGNDAGTLKLQSFWETDVGDNFAFHDGQVTYADDTFFTFTAHVKISTGPGDNNGLYEHWIGDIQVLNQTNVDNDTLVIDKIIVGTSNAESMTITIQNDNVLARTTREIPRPAAAAGIAPLAFDHLAMGHQ